MAARQRGASPGESFQGLLLRLRGRTGLSQHDVAARAGRHVRSIQGWEAGANYPTVASLQVLIATYLAAHGFATGHETEEAAAVWVAALKQAPRLRAPFDSAWFAELLTEQATTRRAQRAPPSARRQDWGEAPTIAGFAGRRLDLGVLRRWVSVDRCRVVAVLGMGGIGKTMLAARLADDLAAEFERVYWRSLHDGLPTNEWLAGAIGFVSDHQMVLPSGESARIGMLLDLLRQKRSLLVLDNLETILIPGERIGRYRDGYGGYGTCIQRVGESSHLSCLLVTCREVPPELGLLRGEQTAVRSMQLDGLGIDAAQAMLQTKALEGDAADWAALTKLYGGNGLALKIAAEAIARLFGHNIAAFLSKGDSVFGGIRQLLDEQLERLSEVELSTLRWFAVDREPLDYAAMSANLAATVGGAVIETIQALQGRSLLAESRTNSSAFALQPVVLEHVTDQLIETLTGEIATGEPDVLLSHALVKATAKDYVRRSQEQLMAAAIVARLVARLGTRAKAETRLTDLLAFLRGHPREEQKYGPGNLVNLLRLLRGDLTGVNLSGLELRQVFLRDVEAHDTNLTGSHLSQAALAESFDFPMPVALSADGAYLAAGTAGGEVRLWRASDRTPTMSVAGQTGGVMSLALSADGRVLATGSLDGTVKLWGGASGRLMAALPGHGGGVWGVALSGDGRLLASGGQDATVKVWDVATGQLLATLAAQSGGVMAVAMSADARLILSGGQDSTIRLWDTATGQLLATLYGHSGAVWAVALSGDGRLAASGGADGMVRLWSVPDGGLLATLAGHADQIWGVALTADGRLIASGSMDGSVKLWESDGGLLKTTLLGHAGVVMGVALSGDGGLAASGGHDGTVRLWEVASGRLLDSLQGRADQVYGAALDGGGRLVAGGGQDGAVRLWEPATGELLATLVGQMGTVWGVALSEDGRLVACGGNDGLVMLWDSASGRPLFSVSAHAGAVWDVALSAGKPLLATGGGDGAVRLWEPATGQLLKTLLGHTGGVSGVALSADGLLVASGGNDGTIRLWKPATGELLFTLVGHTGTVWSVALSGDGQLVASGGADRTAKLWEVTTGRLVATLAGHSGLVRAVALSADGRLVASGSIDGNVSVWESANGRLLRTLKGHTGPVRAVAMSMDGRLLASGSTDGTLRVWDVNDGTALRILRSDRRYERMDITGVTGVTRAQHDAMIALGAIDASVRA